MMQHPELNDLDVLIVGAGLFGQIIGRHLQRQGRTVTLVDAELPHAGSKPAACIMRPSWLSRMNKTQQAESFAVLDNCYGVHEIEAYVSVPGPIRSLGKRTTVHWVAPGSIIKPNTHHKATIVDVKKDGDKSLFLMAFGEPWRTAKLIVMAAGVWANKFPSMPPVAQLTAQAGVAFLWDCDPNRESRVSIQLWAPYKQLVMLPNIRPGKLWVGDGTALKESSLTPGRIAASHARCLDFARAGEPGEPIIGLRPYVKGCKEPCYLRAVHPGIWIATGGAKNGTAAAGWAAYKIAQATN